MASRFGSCEWSEGSAITKLSPLKIVINHSPCFHKAKYLRLPDRCHQLREAAGSQTFVRRSIGVEKPLLGKIFERPCLRQATQPFTLGRMVEQEGNGIGHLARRLRRDQQATLVQSLSYATDVGCNNGCAAQHRFDDHIRE